jgi:mRNA-degrading endonuclease RelE of RelBE toxin-antitoxin system
LLETDPYVGKPLRGDLADKWSLRNGDYRVIYAISEDKKTVLLYDVSHRKKVYK